MSEFIVIDKKEDKRLLKEIKIDKDYVKKSIKKEEVLIPRDYTIYRTNFYSKISNQFFENLTFKLLKKFPNYFGNLKHNLKVADIKIISKTYISIIFFSSSLSFLLFFLLSINLLI